MLAPIIFGRAFDAGIALNTILSACSFGLIVVCAPLSYLLARQRRAPTGRW
jgi:hypothetical protein